MIRGSTKRRKNYWCEAWGWVKIGESAALGEILLRGWFCWHFLNDFWSAPSHAADTILLVGQRPHQERSKLSSVEGKLPAWTIFSGGSWKYRPPKFFRHRSFVGTSHCCWYCESLPRAVPKINQKSWGSEEWKWKWKTNCGKFTYNSNSGSCYVNRTGWNCPANRGPLNDLRQNFGTAENFANL